MTKSSFLALELRSALTLQRSDMSLYLMCVCAYLFLAHSLSLNLFLEIVRSESCSVSLDSISRWYEQCMRKCCVRVIVVFVCVCVHVLQITFAHPAETHDARVHMQMHIAKVSHKKDREIDILTDREIDILTRTQQV